MENPSSKQPGPPEEIPAPHRQQREAGMLGLFIILLLCGLAACCLIATLGLVALNRFDQGVPEPIAIATRSEAESHTQTFLQRYQAGDYASAFATVEQELADNPENLEAHNNLAWLLATCPDPEFRDGEVALEHAQLVCDATNHRKSEYLDTLAAACAELGDFDAAVKWQSEAILQASENANRADFENRLARYQAQEPFRQATAEAFQAPTAAPD